MTTDPELRNLMGAYPGITVETPQSTNRVEEIDIAVKSHHALSQEALSHLWSRFRAEEAEEKQRLIQQRDGLFSEPKIAYSLHAVICHQGGSASAGHYWVWIHDFESKMWYKYNDTTVTKHNAEYVFSELNNKGEPYYLAYVRASEASSLVQIPRGLRFKNSEPTSRDGE